LRDLIELDFFTELGPPHGAVAKGRGLTPGTPVDWQLWHAAAPREEVIAILDTIPDVHGLIVVSDSDVMLGGTAAGCSEVARRVGKKRMIQFPHSIVCHLPLISSYAPTLRQIHTRPVHNPDNVRFYFNAINDTADIDTDVVGEMLTRQALNMVDFPPTVRKAYHDGVRIFIEVGPCARMTGAIRKILGAGDYLAFSLDATNGNTDTTLPSVAQAAAMLFVAGVSDDDGQLQQRFAAFCATQPKSRLVPTEPV
jgi:acyl transferase domain-containing protein